MSSRRKPNWKTLGNVGLAVLAVATAGSIAAVMLEPAPQPPVPSHIAEFYEQNKTLDTPKPFVQVTYAEVKPRLLDPAQPFTIAVIGDSTGNEPGEWVDLAMRRIAEKTGRRLVMSTWDLATNAYGEPQAVVAGAGQPLTVWNGSASGKSGLYAAEYYDKLVPKVPDLAIINHGHNITVATATESQISALIQKLRLHGDGKIAIALTTQNPESGPNRERNEQVMATIRGMSVADKTLHEIDAHSAFNARGDFALTLRPDGLHPSEEGSAIWADTVLASLGF